MSKKWLARGLPLAALLLLAVEPAAAASSTSEALIRGLNQKLLVVAVPITVLVEGILIYTILRFKDSEEAKPTRENRRLEITWTVATAVILLFVGFSAFTVLGNEYVTATPQNTQASNADVQVDVVAEAWKWNFQYPRHNVTMENRLVLQTGQDTVFNITSKDWIHSFHVPGMALKQDAVPGKYNVIKTRPTEAGTYQGYCAEYCGSGHSSMLFTVVVVDSKQQYYDELAKECEADGMTWNEDEKMCVSAGGSQNASA